MDAAACIACCLICTLGEKMKDCINCPFKAGLAVKATLAGQAKDNTVFTQAAGLNRFATPNPAIIQD